jgi:AraC family transcriptional regulator
MESYSARINRVIDYIDAHLGDEMDLETLASIACFSKYHFHRLFATHTGETLGAFIQRLRLDKAANLLCSRSDSTVTQIALDCGFSGSAAFAKSFKDRFGQSATAWRAGKSKPGKMDSKDAEMPGKSGQQEGKLEEAGDRPRVYPSYTDKGPIWRLCMETKKADGSTDAQGIKEATVEIRTLPKQRFAYVRHVGPYAGDAGLFERLFGTLYAWAGARDLVKPDSMTIVVYHDSPELVPEDKLRISVCISVPGDTEVSGEIGLMDLEPAKYGVGRFTCATDEYGQAWGWMFGSWLPVSGFVPDDKPCFEAYPEPPLPDGRCIVEIWVPVVPA